MEPMPGTPLQALQALFLRPAHFFRTYLSLNNGDGPFFPLAIAIYGIGYGIDRLDMQLLKHDLRGDLDRMASVNEWPLYWIVAVLGGLIGGFIAYRIGGWFFQVRLRWSKATTDIRTARGIFLHAGMVPNTIILLTTVVSTFITARPYEVEPEFGLWESIVLLLLLFFLFYSIYVSHSGVRAITDADPKRAALWFLLLPMILYSVAYFTLFVVLFEAFA